MFGPDILLPSVESSLIFYLWSIYKKYILQTFKFGKYAVLITVLSI